MSDLIERLEEVVDYDWNHEHAAAVGEAIAEIKRLRRDISEAAAARNQEAPEFV